MLLKGFVMAKSVSQQITCSFHVKNKVKPGLCGEDILRLDHKFCRTRSSQDYEIFHITLILSLYGKFNTIFSTKLRMAQLLLQL